MKTFQFIDVDDYVKSFEERLKKFMFEFIADVEHELEGLVPKEVTTRVAFGVAAKAFAEFDVNQLFLLTYTAHEGDIDAISETMLMHSQNVQNKTILLLQELANEQSKA